MQIFKLTIETLYLRQQFSIRINSEPCISAMFHVMKYDIGLFSTTIQIYLHRLFCMGYTFRNRKHTSGQGICKNPPPPICFVRKICREMLFKGGGGDLGAVFTSENRPHSFLNLPPSILRCRLAGRIQMGHSLGTIPSRWDWVMENNYFSCPAMYKWIVIYMVYFRVRYIFEFI